MTEQSRESSLLALFEGRADALLESLKTLVELESPSDDPECVTALARYIAVRLTSLGFEAKTVPCEGRGDALVARHGNGRGGTLLLGHLDTVWPKGTLAEIPFSVTDGIAKGPGVFDMKAGIAVTLAVFEAIANGEVKPNGPVAVVLTPDEEVGTLSSRGAFLVAQALERDHVLVLEPAGDGGAAKIARKGTGLATVKFHGIASHAGLDPEKGASALLELSRYVLFADALADREVGSSVVPTVASAGSRTNVVPEAAQVIVDYRVWTAREGERITNALSGYRPIDGRVTVEVDAGVNRPPMEPNATSLDIYARAAEHAREIGFDLPNARVGGASDGNLTAAAGVPTLDGLGPSGGGAHARSEHLVVADLPRRAALLAALLEDAASLTRGVTVRDLEGPEEFRESEEVSKDAWQFTDRAVSPASDLIAATHSGGLTAGAFEGKRMLGFVHGIPRTNLPEKAQHSHLLAVRREAQGRGLSTILKLYQRRWCLDRGIALVTWTYDPFLLKNAQLNIMKLRATVRSILPDFYGVMGGIYGSLPTDRFEITWRLDSAEAERAAAGEPPLFPLDSPDVPIATSRKIPDAPRLALPFPAGAPRTYATEPERTTKEKRAFRRLATQLFEKGYEVYAVALREAFPVYLLRRRED